MTGGFTAASAPRAGEGVSDPVELARLIDMLRRAEAAGRRLPDLQIGEFLVDGARVPKGHLAALQSMTRTEAAAMRLLGWGRSNADIAMLLAINESTVRSHLNTAVAKLGVDGMRTLACISGLLFHPLD